jgi:hypothetical protein
MVRKRFKLHVSHNQRLLQTLKKRGDEMGDKDTDRQKDGELAVCVDEGVSHKIGDKYIKPNGCEQCGADLEITYGVAVMCVNWQHPHQKSMYRKGGLRNCDCAILSG